MADTQLYLGLDLGPEYTQLSYYNADTREPESVYHEEAKDTYMLPNIMFYSAYHKKIDDGQKDCYRFIDLSGWCVGAKASAYRFEENGTVVDRVYEGTLKNENIEVEGRSYRAAELMVKMLVLHIKQFTDTLGAFVIKKLTVTVADTDPRIIQAVRGLKTALQLSHDQFNIVSHLDSGLCYIFAQPEPLRNNSVGLFDFGRNGLDFYRIDMTRKYPLIVTTQHTNYHDRMNMKRFGRYHEDMDETFADIVKECMDQVFVSSVFLTGLGFSENWMKQSAAVLCQGRRVFVGQNIYTKGACYRSLGGVYTESLSRYFIDTEQTVKTNIGINLMDEKNTFWPIVYGGLEWFNTRGRATVFLDDTRRIQIVYQDILTEEELQETIEIYGLPARPPKTTKLSIEVEYYGADKGAIVIRDVGFGNLYPTTNKIYRKEFYISALKKKKRKKERSIAAEGDTEELIGDDPVDRTGAAEAEDKARQQQIMQEDIAAQDALKQEIHMDLDDLRYGSDDDKGGAVYYGTASPVQEEAVTEPELEGEAEDEAVVEPELEGEAEDEAVAEPEPKDEAMNKAGSVMEAGDGAETETEVEVEAENASEAVESEEEPAIEPESEEGLYDDPVEESGEDDGEDDIEDSDEDLDENLDEDLNDDESVQSRFTIPAYLRGQHFDPGE